MGSEELILEASKSGELTAVLHTLSETEVDGEPKFSAAICREISKMVVCRTYATPIMELCHLIVIASELSIQKGRYEFFFWDSGVARTSAFHSYCDHQYPISKSPALNLENAGICLKYSGRGEFTIHYSRMPLLSALLEFLLTALGYADIDEDLQKLLQEPVTKQTVSACANTLSRRLYGYLKEHLPTAQSQRKFRQALAYCDNDVDSVDDNTLLNFWQEASVGPDKGTDFKTFDSVLLTFIRTIQAVDAARDLVSMKNAGSIGSDREAGEIDPDMLSETLDSVNETLSPLLQLSDDPINKVKFLNKQETASLENLMCAGTLALRLPLSVLRSDTFTKPQSRLTQALRRKASVTDLAGIIKDGPEDTYQDKQLLYAAVRDHITRAIYASLHILARARVKEAIPLLLKLDPHIDFTPLAEHLIDEDDTNVVTLNQKNITDRFMDMLHDASLVGIELAGVMSDAQTAYSNLSRKGFKEDPAADPSLIQAFVEGAGLLIDISQDIEAYLERLDNMPLAGGGWQSQFSYDRTIFCGQFSKIYGEVA